MSSSILQRLVVIAFLSVAGCSEEMEITADIDAAAEAAASQYVQGKVDLAKVCSDVAVTSTTGVTMQGTMDCAMLHTSKCSESLTSGCYVESAGQEGEGNDDANDEPLVAVKASELKAENIRHGAKIGNVTGTYYEPGDAPVCTIDGQQNCLTDASFKAVKMANFVAADLRAGVSVGGRSGTLNSCTDGAAGLCVLPTSFKAVVADDLLEGHIKAGERIGGKLGKYPSNSYKLPGAGTSGDALTGTNFAARAISAGTTEFWMANGERKTFVGTSQIIPGNIKKDEVIFGVRGTYDVTGVTIAPNDMRKDVTFGGVTGTLLVDCDNAACSTGTNFTDVSVKASDKTTADTCGAARPIAELNDIHCLAKDKITGLVWTRHLGSDTHANAVTFCNNLNTQTYGGKSSGWHLPDRFELGLARLHGLGFFDFKLKNSSVYTRSATEDISSPGNYYLLTFKNFQTPLSSSGSINFVCVNRGG